MTTPVAVVVNRYRRGRRGQAIVEVALMSPWILLLFMGIFNFGFYAYAAIATQNAANMGALYTSSESGLAGNAASACQSVLQELRSLPNMSGVVSCEDFPVKVTAVTSPDPCEEGQPCDSTVSVTYRTVPLFPIPSLMDRMTLSRTSTMRVHPDL